MDNDTLHSTALLAFLAWCTAVSFTVLDDDDDEEDEESPDAAILAQGVLVMHNMRKHVFVSDEPAGEPERQKKKCDYERAWLCIAHDCLGPHPLFEKQLEFDRICRVNRGTTERLIQICAAANPFFTR